MLSVIKKNKKRVFYRLGGGFWMKITELTQILNRQDHEALIQLYRLRCLSPHQLHEYCYESKYSSLSEFNEKVIEKLIHLGVVELVLYQNHQPAILLTSIGVDVVRELLDLPTNIITSDKKIIKRGYYRASDLRVLPHFMNHQIHLNEFVLRFKERFETDYPELPYHYFDEKHMGTYDIIRPDGLIQLLDIDIFLEMDMNKESKAQLQGKWSRYRNYFTSQQHRYQERQILILFICEGTDLHHNRTQLVQKTAFEFIGDLFSPEFDLIVGTTEELIELLFSRLIPKWRQSIPPKQQLRYYLEKQLDFQLYRPVQIHQLLKRTGYELFLKHRSGKEDLEFLFDDWRLLNLSVLNTISLHQKNNGIITRYYKRPLKYLILIQDEEIVAEWLELNQLLKESGVCFTTLARLKKYPLYKAIFIFNEKKQRYHFKDEQFKQLVLETE